MYLVQWQMRGLTHAHIPLWMFDKNRPDYIESIFSAEILETDPELHSVMTMNMIHGPCGIHSAYSPCMENGNIANRFRRPLVADTISKINEFPIGVVLYQMTTADQSL